MDFFLTWSHCILILSALTSSGGLWWLCRQAAVEPNPDLSEAETTAETLLRMTFAYWVVHCVAHEGERYCDRLALGHWSCSLHILTVLSFVLTFCCLLSLGLQAIEHHQSQIQ